MAVSSVPKKKHKSSLSKPCLITLRIELVGTTPLVWRRITLEGSAWRFNTYAERARESLTGP